MTDYRVSLTNTDRRMQIVGGERLMLQTGPHLHLTGTTAPARSLTAVASLSEEAESGATTVTLSNLPADLMVDQYVLIGAQMETAELRRISAIDFADKEIMLDTALANDHNSAESVYFLHSAETYASWFGAELSRSDNETPINAALIQAAGYRGTVLLQELYVTNGPVVMPSYAGLEGVNFSGGVHNAYASTGVLSTCILVGQHNPSQNDNYTWRDLLAVSAGDLSLICVTPVHAGDAPTGSCLFVRSAEYSRDDNLQKPLVCEIVRVVSADPDTGIITLDTPVTETIANARFAYIDGAVSALGIDSYICDSPRLRALRVRTDNGTWMLRQAAIDAEIDVQVVESNDLFICNALRAGRVRVRGNFYQRGFEGKTGMMDTLVEIVGQYVYRADRLPDSPLIDFGEHNKRNILRGPILDAPLWDGVSLVDMQSSYNQIDGGRIYAPDFTGRAVFLRSGVHDAYTPRGNRVEGVTFDLTAPERFVSIGINDVGIVFSTNYLVAPYTFAAVAHGLANYWPVRLTTTGALPSPMQPGVTYWVSNKTADTFELSADPGGVSIGLTNNGSGTHTVNSYLASPQENRVSNCVFTGTPTADAIYGLHGVKNQVVFNRFGGGAVNIPDAATFYANVIQHNSGLDGVNTAVNRQNAAKQQFSHNTPPARLADFVTHIDMVYADAIQTTTPNAVAATLAIAVGSTVYEGDAIHFVVEGNIVGIAAGKTVQIADATNGITLATLTLPTSPGGKWSFGGSVLFHDDSTYVYDFLMFRSNTNWTAAHGRQAVLSVAANGLVIQLQAWVTNAADKIVIDRAQTWLKGPGYD